jgi:hypothetical protein
MSEKKTITLRLLDKIESDLTPESFKNYKTIFTAFIKGEISFAQYHDKMHEILGLKLLPFHQRFVSLFRK